MPADGTGDRVEPTASSLAGTGVPLSGLGDACPAGLCPNGATCSKDLGQWQCGCGVGGCSGSK